MSPWKAAHRALVIASIILVHDTSHAQPTASRVRPAADSLLAELHARGWFSGAVVLGRSGEPLYARGFGFANIQARAPYTPDTPTDGGSIAKTLTAAAIFMLQDEGRLALDDHVRTHLPEYPHGKTRIRDLLAHSTGLPETEYDFFEPLIPPDRVKTTSLFLDILRERGVPPGFEPGTRFRYSSLGYDVAALVVERVSGQRWDAFLRERVFAPLGMTQTFLRPAKLAEWPGVRTMSYRPEGDALVVHDVFENEGFYGGSNLYFSARDLYYWSRSFYTRPVLGNEALERARDAAILEDTAAGVGGRSKLNLSSWYYPERGRRYHYPGALQGFWSSVYRDEDQRYSIVYVSNASMPQWLRPLLTRALIDILEGRRPPPLAARAFWPATPEDLDAIAGTFVVDGVGRVTLARYGTQALMQVDDDIQYPAFFLGDDQLYVPGFDVWLGFPRDSRTPYGRLSWLSIFHVSSGDRAR